ncbi:MAG TPA: hypothetical protein VGJ83_02915 [Gemmatimonadales bacterium]
MRRLTVGLLLLRATGLGALLLLLWNPLATRPLPAGVQSIVLLDASLSMRRGAWPAARDSARALAGGQGGLVWRFGARVASFDTAPPSDGASRLGPALEAAAARGGEVTVVTDGAVDDLASIPADLLRRPRVVVLPRSSFRDAFVASVDGQRRVASTDTVRLRVSYGTAGMREAGGGMRDAALAVSVGGARLLSRRVTLPDSGTASTDLTLPASRIPHPGWNVLDVRLEGVGDVEPRDDARRFVVEVSPQPAVVIFAAPPDWDTRFLARTLADVAQAPVKTFVEAEPGRWRDAAALTPVSPAELSRAARGARLVVLGGKPERARRYAGSAAVLEWPGGEEPGDWYVERPPASPLAPALGGIAWDSLPPVVVAAEPPRDSGRAGAIAVLSARLARRGAPRTIVTLHEGGGAGAGGAAGTARRATVTASGLWRWAFRGGPAEQAYRSLVAAVADWLLAERGAGRGERAAPVTLEVPNGLPLVWRWTGGGDERPLVVELRDETGAARIDTLRFDAGGHAELLLPPGAYRYALAGGPERGLVAVEEYSDEWRPAARLLASQPGLAEGRTVQVGLRDRWWLFVIAIAAFSAEWAWRRRQGLP